MSAKQKKQGTKQQGELTKCWTRIGRFFWIFGTIESWINEIFLALYELERVPFPFIGMIDTRKKIRLVEEGLHEKGDTKHNTLLKQVHELHTLRNVFAHCCFHVAQGGVEIDHVTHQGSRWSLAKDGDDTYISFETFDTYLQNAEQVVNALIELHGRTTPISSFSRDFSAAIEEIIDASPNVVRYVPRLPDSTS